MIQRTTRQVPAFAFHTCRLALTSCSTNHHWCLPKNRTNEKDSKHGVHPSHGAGCRMTARENVSQTHTSSESAMRNSMSSRPNDKIGQKTLSKFKRCSLHRHRLQDDTCFAHPNWNSSTQRADLETYVDNVGQRDRRNDICVANKAP